MLKDSNLNEINKIAWDSFHEDYMKFHLLETPDYYEFFANGGIRNLDQPVIDLTGDVNGLKLLDTCCACDASQAFSWNNLGASVTACDISPKAIEIAKKNARIMDIDVEFVIADAQVLSSIENNQYDIVFATYPVWLQDLEKACKTWYRVLKLGGRLLLHMTHPVTECLYVEDGNIKISRDYNKPDCRIYENFGGTPMSNKYGGYESSDKTAESFYRISDVLNAMSKALFTLKITEEIKDDYHNSDMKELPFEIFFIAEK